MRNIIVLGKGYISKKIDKYWSLDDYNLIRLSRSEIDYCENLRDIISLYNPVVVINAYGYTGSPNVDACEDASDECYMRNVENAISFMNICIDMGVNFITVTTGCLYNDESGKVFTEECEPNFGRYNPTASVYSKSKSWFEYDFKRRLADDDGDIETRNYALRIRMPFDDEVDDKNYISKIIKYDNLINYQNSVTYVYDLVKFIEIIVRDDVPSGVYNVVNQYPITAEEVIAIYTDITGNSKRVDGWYSTDDLLSKGLMKCRRSNCVLSTDKIIKYYPNLMTSRAAIIDALTIYSERKSTK